MSTPALSPDEIDHFIAHGFVKLPQALDQATVRRCADRVWARLGYDPADPSTWAVDKIHMPNHELMEATVIAPRAYAAICQLCGGEDRIQRPLHWSDGFIANFTWGADRPLVPPSPAASGWHKDGDFFLHFLDSPEQGLLTVVLWSDVQSDGGGATYLACDSVAAVARHLAANPAGVNPGSSAGEYGAGFPIRELIAECGDFREAAGEAGDVYLLHPFLLHASSQNRKRYARLITNPPVMLREPMRFDRADPVAHSPVERAVLRGLGVERQRFVPTRPRQMLTPPRVAAQRELQLAEAARLKAAVGPG